MPESYVWALGCPVDVHAVDVHACLQRRASSHRILTIEGYSVVMHTINCMAALMRGVHRMSARAPDSLLVPWPACAVKVNGLP